MEEDKKIHDSFDGPPRMMSKTLLLLVPLLFVGCPELTPDPVTPAPNPPPDTDWCQTMCDHIGPEGLGCEEGEPVYNVDKPGPVDVPNQSCDEWCTEMQDKGFFVNPKCVSDVQRCDQIEEFRQREPDTCGPAGVRSSLPDAG